MEDTAFDKALVGAAFELAAGRGWARVTVADAARHAGLRLDEARARFPGRAAILLRFGRIADMAALEGGVEPGDTTPRDRLFDIVMRRIDVLQAHRDGVQALLRYLPLDPSTALMLALATQRSMAWLLDGASIRSTGALGQLRAQGLLAIWLWTVRAWQRDESGELSATMAALDNALGRAMQAEAMLRRRSGASASAEFTDTAQADVVAASDVPGDLADDEPVQAEAVPVPPDDALPISLPPPPSPDAPPSPPI